MGFDFFFFIFFDIWKYGGCEECPFDEVFAVLLWKFATDACGEWESIWVCCEAGGAGALLTSGDDVVFLIEESLDEVLFVVGVFVDFVLCFCDDPHLPLITEAEVVGGVELFAVLGVCVGIDADAYLVLGI